ncbi:MAG: c-type cytochrome [Planctomycetota bacterium]|nr:c-type cytochrome [Planctomycetota bacterium]MDA1212672.1 c-type cytochrome [Planctomycetota bacterium]
MTDPDSLSPSEIAKQLLRQHKSDRKASRKPGDRSPPSALTFEVVSPRAKKKPSAANRYKPVEPDVPVVDKANVTTTNSSPSPDNAPSRCSIWQKMSQRKATLASISLILFGVTFSGMAMFSPSQAELTQQGKILFEHEWQANDPLAAEGDGLGPVFNAKSCVACHFQGGIGGAGPNQNNVTAFEVDPRPTHPEKVLSGVVHASAILPSLQETTDYVRELFPIVRKGERIIGSCNSVTFRDFDPLRITSINTPALFGSGLIDGISEGEIKRNMYARAFTSMGKEFQLDFSSTPIGRYRKLDDGRVGKFGWKAQFATLEDFVAAACAVEVGLTNPHRPQEKPKHQGPDDEAGLDLNGEQFLALVTFCETLPSPQLELPVDAGERSLALAGQNAFISVGCADCHTPNLGGVEGIYSDLLLHRMSPPDSNGSYGRIERDIPIPDNYPKPDEWKTPPLWGVADTAPYYHDGESATLEAAIERHDGEARNVRKKYRMLKERERQAIIAFLNSLRAPQLPTTAAANNVIASQTQP